MTRAIVTLAIMLVTHGALSGCDSGEASAGTAGSQDATASGTGGSGSGQSGGATADVITGTPPVADVTTGTPPVADTNTGSTPPDGSGGPGTVITSAEATSSGCIDGQYTETLPTPEVSLDADIAAYTPAGYLSFIDAALQKRYPIGAYLVSNALLDQSWGHCVDLFLHQKNTAEQVIGSMSTLVHECGHFLDSSVGGFFEDAYVITDTLTITCSGGSTPDNGGGKTFSRSLINGDEYAPLWPPCASFGAGGQCDSYGPIYLNGDPTDTTFDSGDQGFGSLLEETVQYVNSLATGYAFNDFYGWGASERDGILTFFWYLQRYLRLARLEHPSAYQHLIGSSCWREAILTAWGRGWMFLLLTEAYPSLGIADNIIEPLALDAVLQQEIQLVREAHGCP